MYVDFFAIPAIRDLLAWIAVVGHAANRAPALYRITATRLERAPSAGELAFIQTRLGISAGHTDVAEHASLGALAGDLDSLRQSSSARTVGETVWRILVTSGIARQAWISGTYAHRLALSNIGHLVTLAQAFSRQYQKSTVSDFAYYLDIMREVGGISPEIPRQPAQPGVVELLTVHAAKGLEFDAVMIPFLASGSFPNNFRPPKLIDSPPRNWLRHGEGQISEKEAYYEEEQRIFYVAVTRARNALILLAPEKRQSRLIKSLPKELFVTDETITVESERVPSTHDELRIQLRQLLNRELNDGAFTQARHIINAMELISNDENGIAVDWTSNPFGQQIQEKIRADAPAHSPDRKTLTLSPSSISLYETCQLKYRFQYIDRVPQRDEGHPAMAVGSAVHAVLEAYHAPASTLDKFDMETELRKVWRPADFRFKQEEQQHLQDTREMLDRYVADHPPGSVSVLAVEHSFLFAVGATNVRGRIDRLDTDAQGDVHIIDYKTSRTPLTEGAAHKDLQLGIYALYVEQAKEVSLQGYNLGRLPASVTYFYLRAEDPEVRVQHTSADLSEYRNRIETAATGIRQGVFAATASDRDCSYCDYRDLICPRWEHKEI